MKNTTKKRSQITRSENALMFIESNIMPAPRQVVGIPGLYGAYRRHTIRFVEPVSKERFVQVLDRNGYRRNGGLLNGLLWDLTLV